MYTHSNVRFFPDQRDVGMGFLGGLVYVPDLAPVGSGSQGTYYPRDTSQDAAALHYLGYFPEPNFSDHVGTFGSRAADANAGVGAWNEDFQFALKNYQRAKGLTVDGWIGPESRRRIAADVLAKNANEQPIPPGPIPIPPGPTPNVLPGPTPGPIPGPTPVSAKTSGLSTAAKVGIGAAALAALGIGYAVFAD